MNLIKGRGKGTQQSFPDSIKFTLFYLMVAFLSEMWLCTNASHQSARRISNNKHTVLFVSITPGGLQHKEKLVGGTPCTSAKSYFTQDFEGFWWALTCSAQL